MKIEKKFKRDNGDAVVVSMEIWTNYNSDTCFRTGVSLIPKGKRKPIWDSRSCSFGDEVLPWNYRSLSMDEREVEKRKFILQYITIEELREVRDELIEKIRTDDFRF